jgi:flagellar basal-body rod modification protein FlgD
MSNINTSGLSPVSSTDTTTNPNSTLTQADFLQLLVTQMTSQDPLNPVSDTDFAAQLAQFSNLQETTSMAGNLSNLQAQSLIGMTVNVASATNGTQTTTGVVTGVDISSSAPEIVVNNEPYSLSQITSILPTQTTSPTTSATSATSATTPAAPTVQSLLKPSTQ